MRAEGAAFALPIARVVEVARMVALATAIPQAPRYCLGAIDYHGRLVPAIDLGARLGRRAPQPPEALLDARVVILARKSSDAAGERKLLLERELLGLIVDEVRGVSEREPEPPPSHDPLLAGLVLGVVRYREGEKEQAGGVALLVDDTALLPGVAGIRLRRALEKLQPGRPVAAEAEAPAAGGLGLEKGSP